MISTIQYFLLLFGQRPEEVAVHYPLQIGLDKKNMPNSLLENQSAIK